MFKRTKKNLPSKPREYPTGLCVKTEVGHFYINGKIRHRIGSKRVFDSWAFSNVITGSEASLAGYRKGRALGFRDGSLIREISTGRFYFISQRKKRLVTNPDIITGLGLKFKDAIWASDFEVNLHEEGENLS